MDSEKEKKVEKVVSGPVKTKKKSELSKVANRLGLVPEDIDDVKDYIIREQIVPTFKNLFFDMLQTIVFGDTNYRSGSRRRGSSRTSYESYYYDSGKSRDNSRNKSRGNFNYDELIFDTRGDAEEVLDILGDMMHRYHNVSIADLYDAAGITKFSYTYNNYGWDEEEDIAKARIVRNSDGFMIKLPKPRPIN